jgi:hypothetical protein
MSRTVKDHGLRTKSRPSRRVKPLPRDTRRRPLQIPRSVEYHGLCSVCKCAPDCTYPRDPDHMVIQCEEFDGIEPLSARATGKHRSPPALSHADRDKGAAKFNGLCSNCENREGCVFPKPEGGVWHCEEYL